MVHLPKLGNLRNIAILSMAALASTALPSGAIPYGTNQVYRAGQEVIISATAGSKVEVGLGSTVRNKAVMAGSCGQVKVTLPKTPPATIQVGTKTLTIASLPTQSLPSCKKGEFAEARTADFKTPQGQIVAVGFTPNQSVTIAMPTVTTRKVSINACGFGTLKNVSGSFTVNSQNYTVSQLPDAGSPPVCRKGTGYTPSTWSR